jgi:GntR family transcriptional regulator
VLEINGHVHILRLSECPYNLWLRKDANVRTLVKVTTTTPTTIRASAIDRTSPLPLWAQVLADLRARLSAGEFAESFPTDSELVASYDVSRHTVRDAVRRLHAEGLLDRERGRGTTVRSPMIAQPTGHLYSLFASIEAQGYHQRSEVVALERRQDARAAEQLGLSADASMLHLRRIRFADDTPIALDELWLPDTYSDALLGVDFEHTALYDELATLGVRPTSGWERLHPAVADAPARRALGLRTGQAVFQVERYTEFDGTPLEWRLTTIRGDHYAFVTTWSSADGTTAALQRTPE